MKLKVYILKKSQIITALIISFILLLSIILLIAFKSKETIKNVTPVKTVYCDVDGDKKLDTLYIQSNSKGDYNITLKTKKGDGFILEPDPLLKTFGENIKNWPIYIECKDINNDDKQEIIIQGSKDNKPVLHIYSYNDIENKIFKVASGEYNIFASTIHNKKPVIMLGKSGEKIETFYYTYNGDLEKFNNNIDFASQTLISLCTFINEDEIEVINTTPSTLSNIEKGNFLDAILIDIKYKDDIPFEILYQVRSLAYGDSTTPSLYEVKMSPISYKNYNLDYKITDVSKIK